MQRDIERSTDYISAGCPQEGLGENKMQQGSRRKGSCQRRPKAEYLPIRPKEKTLSGH